MKTQIHFDPLAGHDATFHLEVKRHIFKVRNKEIALEIPTWISDASELEYPEPDFGDPLVAAYNAYRKVVGLPSPERMKEQRKCLGLSVKAFATLLGIGDASVSRYEKGALPSLLHQRAYKEFGTPAGMRRLLETNGTELETKDQEKILAALKSAFGNARVWDSIARVTVEITGQLSSDIVGLTQQATPSEHEFPRLAAFPVTSIRSANGRIGFTRPLALAV